MSQDKITQSMLGNSDEPKVSTMLNGIKNDLQQSAEKNAEPPAIDLTDLDNYSIDGIKQCLLDMRIKLSRINEEMNELHKTIEKARAEMSICHSRSRFYQIVRNQLIRYLQTRESCQQEKDISQHEKSSVQ